MVNDELSGPSAMRLSGCRIRPLAARDASDAAALIRAAFAAQSVVTDPPPSALGETAESVRAQLVRGGGFGAEREGRLVGVVLWALAEGGMRLGRLAVAPGWRGRGTARALVGAVEAEARRRGLPRLHLGVRVPLVGNRRLFAALGFRETALFSHPGHAEPTSVAMEKALGGPPSPTAVSPVGHNGGPPLDEAEDAPDPGASWRRLCWPRAHRRAWKTPPREIALRRLERAEALGMTYREYAREIMERGRFP